MKNALSLTISMLALGLSSVTPVVVAAENQADSITAAIAGGNADLALRYRYEYVDQDGSDEANASTLQTRLTFKTLSYQGFSSVLEFDNNSIIIEDDYETKQATTKIADLTYTEINQAYLDYAAPADTLIRYGRQRINLDNQRFIGGVAWRQNEQTYDALTVINKSLPETTIHLSHVFNVNDINGLNTGEGDQLININNNSVKELNLSAYAYLIDKVNDTYGVRAVLKPDMGDLKPMFAAEYATQETDTAVAKKPDYLNLEASVDVASITALLGFESLGSDEGTGFNTPYATKHKFNGWADKFLATPGVGLEDTYVSLATAQFGPKLELAYHQFDSDKGSTDFGDEIDLSIAQKFTDNYSGLLKFASFSEGDKGNKKTDTLKIWAQLVATF